MLSNLPKKIHSNASAIIGRKWAKVHESKTRCGRELFCVKLAVDLQRNLAFDSDIITTYEIRDAGGKRVEALSASDYIKSSDSYFSPAAADERLWILGPLTACARAWHQYRTALGQHLFGHAESPYDESTGQKVRHHLFRNVAPAVDRPATPPDPLFDQPLTREESKDETDKAPPNKSPGEDGVENQMVKAGGEPFQCLLHEAFDALWQYEVQPQAWQITLLHMMTNLWFMW